jgi:hypothetical protein
VALALVLLLVGGAIGIGANFFLTQEHAAKRVAATYLSALDRGDFDTAYDQWCAADQAVYPPAAYRAQHESWQGDVDAVRGATISVFTNSGTSAYVDYVTAGSSYTHDIAMRRVHGTWQVCPTGDRLASDLASCACMTPTQQFESQIAFVLNDRRAEYPLDAIHCPGVPALAGQPVVCHGTSRDGRAWDIQAVESGSAAPPTVQVLPTTT